MTGSATNILTAFATVGMALAAVAADARETDQFTRRPEMLAALRDSAPGFDAWVNQQLDQAALTAPSGVLEQDVLTAFIASFFLDPLLPQLHSKVESWATGLGARGEIFLDRPAGRGIYNGTTLEEVKWSWFTGVANTLRLGETLVGVDKLGHFFSQGWQYFLKAREGERAALSSDAVEDSVRELGHSMELGRMGYSTMAMYSPGDLAANWAGWRFWKRVFDGKTPYFAIEAGRLVRRAIFHASDFITPDWDEALNPPYAVSPELAARIQKTIKSTCLRDLHHGILRAELPAPATAAAPYRVPESRLPKGSTRLRFECD